MKIRAIQLSVLGAIGLMACFQNCSPAKFSTITSASTATSTTGTMAVSLMIEGGRSATNKQILNAAFTNLPSANSFSKMRIAEASQFSKASWQSFSANTMVDLGSAYISDGKGSLDTVKIIQAELMPSDGSATITVSAQILLDTLPPTGLPLGILADGPPAGQVLNFGQGISLSWSDADQVSPVTHNMSGLDPQNGIKIAYSSVADCTQSNVTFISNGMAPTNSYSGFPWQSKTPADTFYICIYIQDVAGNVYPILSQPMTNLWTVLAGDNNQGNGGSATGAGVRFNVPYAVAADSKNNVYIADNFLNTVRVVSGQTGVIGLFAGNGQAIGNPIPGDATQSPVVAPSKVFVDAQDRVYIVSAQNILRVTPQATGPALLEKWMPLNNIRAITIDRTTSLTNKSGTLYVSVVNDYTISSNAAGAYILKMSIDDIDANFPNASATFSSLVAKYVYAGTGCLDVNGTSDYQTTRNAKTSCVDLAGGLAFADANTLYLVTNQVIDGTRNDLRKLVLDSSGNLQNIWVASMPRAVGNQMEYINQIDSSNKTLQSSLLVATDGSAAGVGLLKYDLLTNKLSNIDPFSAPSLPTLATYGVAQYQRSSLTAAPTIIIPDASNSRVATASLVSGVLTQTASFGRPVYSATDTIATQAVINNPIGLAQDKANNIYFFEGLSGIIRKVDPTGKISLFAGSPGVQVQVGSTTTPISQMTFNGLGTLGGAAAPLLYSPDDNALFLGESHGLVRKLDLTSQLASLYGPVSSSSNVYDSWSIMSLAISPIAGSVDTKGLYVLHVNPLSTGATGYEVKYSGSGGVNDLKVAGNGLGGYMASGVAASSTSVTALRGEVFDGAGNLYMSGNGFFKIDKTSSMTSKISNVSFTNMILFENEVGGGLHFIGLNGTQLYHFAVASNGTVTNDRLCIPGTFLNAANNIIKTSDGNIAFSDSSNNRVLKYFIRDQNNNLTFSTCN